MESNNPPLHEAYKKLLEKTQNDSHNYENDHLLYSVVEECEVPVIDVGPLKESDELGKEECKCDIARASRDYGFFLVVNHGIPNKVFTKLRIEQDRLFNQSFYKKSKEQDYRWGNPSARCTRQFSWSEAFHIPLTNFTGSSGSNTTLSSAMEQFSTQAFNLAQTLADILAEKMDQKSKYFQENCLPSCCYIRLNRYPPYPFSSSEVDGLMPHTDSDFLTILHIQDQVGGLQMLKDGKWISVTPNPDTLIIIIGDLSQAWSNGVYKSVEHRVVTNPTLERFSMAYFFCPLNDTIIESCREESSIYRKFTFGEYRQQVRDNVQKLGFKIGLSKFLI